MGSGIWVCESAKWTATGEFGVKVERSERDGVTVVHIAGNLNTPSALEMKRMFSDLMVEEKYDIVVNLRQVAQINYAGVGILLERLRKVRQNDGNLKLTGLSRYMQGVFRMVGALKIFETYDSDDAAVESFHRGSDAVAAAGGQP